MKRTEAQQVGDIINGTRSALVRRINEAIGREVISDIVFH